MQGVGFRPWVYRTAVWSGVTGRVLNDSSGVTIDAFGATSALETFERALHTSPPPAACIVEYHSSAIQPEPATSFVIVESERTLERRVSIPPDLAVCDDCVKDIFNPADRRYRYAFTNCSNCGPRFTVATDEPYDRAATTMAPFAMCGRCRHEYEDVNDRRFHAEPTACPDCGPRLTLLDGNGLQVPARSAREGDEIALAARALRRGEIVAVKGLGGFHLACDATSEAAVARLRARKHREEKPLAVMVRTVADVDALAVATEEERRLLTSAERPIVLLARRAGSPIADAVAPRNRQLGVMLAYTPLHHLLLADAGTPLVMTSGNLSDEPIAFENGEAVARLKGIADWFLVHDRAIAVRCDDSVASVIGGRGRVFRRSRGFVPRAIHVGRRFKHPLLACGALLKNTFCLASDDTAFLGPHIGDLENLDTFEAYADAIERLQRFLRITPEVVAHDMHPDYVSTLFAAARPEAVRIPVQHHHAHVVSVMAEHHLPGPVIGVAYDGTGYGLDGTSWGAEVLISTAARFNRFATFRPIPLVGGDHAIREPWRIAFAAAFDAFDGDVPGDLFSGMPRVGAADVAAVAAVLASGELVASARGIGRYFDAFGSLFLGRARAAFEGQVALEWDQIADAGVSTTYPFDIHAAADPWEVDLRPALRQAVDDRSSGVTVSAIAAAFHNTIVAATAALVRGAAARFGRLAVCAGGGCFQNRRLAEGVRAALPDFDVWLPEQVPPGDGGIALGQAVIADAVVGP